MITELSSDKVISSYQPSEDVVNLTQLVKDDFQTGYDILNRPWVELNDLSVIERDNRDRRTFNAFVDENIEDPAEAWKWRGTRSKARNKAIAMHAQVTAGYIIPNFMAQNEDDEEDLNFSDLMRDIVEWMVYNSEYKSSYLQITMGMLVSPVVYLGAEYAEIMQEIKEKTEKGYTKREIIDEVLSGFKAPVYSCDQIMFGNAYEQNIQKQRFIVKTKWVEYSELKSRYEDHENFQYVEAGTNSVFNPEDGLFYDTKDPDHPDLVQVVTWSSRTEDSEVVFAGGIYLGDDNVEANPMCHRDNRGAPKYNVTPFGYQRIGEHFAFYKSLMNAQYWDNQLLDAQYEIGMNRAFLDANMPIAISCTDQIDSDIVFPSSVVAFKDKDVKATPLLPQANLGNMFAAMGTVEKSMDESSVSDVSAGQLPGADQKATGLAIAEKNAKTLLQGVGKTLAESMSQYGQLMADIAVNHYSIPMIDQLHSIDGKLKYRSFVLKDKVVNGKQVSKTIRFDESLLGKEMTDEEKKEEEIKMAMKTGYPEHKNILIRANPELFSRMKYLTHIVPELMFPKNEEWMQAMLMQLVNQFAQNPYVSLEALTRETMYAFFRGRADNFMQKAPQQPVQPMAGPDGKPMPQPTAGAQAVNKTVGMGIVPSVA